MENEFKDVLNATKLRDFFSININPSKREIVRFSGGEANFRLVDADGSVNEITVPEKIDEKPNPEFDKILFDPKYDPEMKLGDKDQFDFILQREIEKHKVSPENVPSLKDELVSKINSLIEIERENINDQNTIAFAKRFIDWLQNSVLKSENPPKETFMHLKDACVSDEAYQKIIVFLVEKKAIHPDTHAINTEVANIKILSAFIKKLLKLNYLSKKITNDEIVKILNNDFACYTTINTVKRPKATDVPPNLIIEKYQ